MSSYPPGEDEEWTEKDQLISNLIRDKKRLLKFVRAAYNGPYDYKEQQSKYIAWALAMQAQARDLLNEIKETNL